MTRAQERRSPCRPGPAPPIPLGATFDGSGTNFALFSEVAEQVELCLFDERRHRDPGRADRGRRATSGTATCRRCSPASATATGCTGRTTPQNGLRCNPNKLLLDPYAKATVRRDRLGPVAVLATTSATRTRATTTTPAAHMMHGVVINPFFDWAGDRAPSIPYNETRDLRGPRQGPHRAAPRRARRTQRGTYAGARAPARSSSTCRSSASPRSS